jgi:hypothetical protein
VTSPEPHGYYRCSDTESNGINRFRPAERLYDERATPQAMATKQGTLSFRRLALQIVLVLIVISVVVRNFGNLIFAVVGFVSGLLLMLVAVDPVRNHPLYPVAFGVTIVLSGVAGFVVGNPRLDPILVLLILSGLAIIAEWGYGRYVRS